MSPGSDEEIERRLNEIANGAVFHNLEHLKQVADDACVEFSKSLKELQELKEVEIEPKRNKVDIKLQQAYWRRL